MGSDKGGGARKPLSVPPVYIKHRMDVFERLYKIQQEELKSKPATPIKITLPDGTVKDGTAWVTTPYDVAAMISNGLAQSAVIAVVNDKQWDMTRPLEEDSTMSILKFSDPEGQEAFWHSSAHFLGEAMELMYGGDLAYGPPIETGFFYDMKMDGTETIKDSELKDLEGLMTKMSKEKQTFERLRICKADLLEMFKYNPFKQRIIREKVMTEYTTAYRCGPLIDLCRGPHIRHAGQIKGIAIHKASSSYWEGNAKAESLQRVYGITFPDKAQLKQWKTLQEEAAKRDHRKIGIAQELFFFHEWSAGSAFVMPHGARIYNGLQNLIREGYAKRGFEEVITPNIFNTKLWMTSGHLQHYEENMFIIKSGMAELEPDAELDALKADLDAAQAVVDAEKEAYDTRTKDLIALMDSMTLDEGTRKQTANTLNAHKARAPMSLRKAKLKFEQIKKRKTRRENVLREERHEQGELLKLELEDANMSLQAEVQKADVVLGEGMKAKGVSRGELFFMQRELQDADQQLPKDMRALR